MLGIKEQTTEKKTLPHQKHSHIIICLPRTSLRAPTTKHISLIEGQHKAIITTRHVQHAHPDRAATIISISLHDQKNEVN